VKRWTKKKRRGRKKEPFNGPKERTEEGVCLPRGGEENEWRQGRNQGLRSTCEPWGEKPRKDCQALNVRAETGLTSRRNATVDEDVINKKKEVVRGFWTGNKKGKRLLNA